MLHTLVIIFLPYNIFYVDIKRGEFKGVILAKVFKPPYVCTASISSSVQFQTVTRISRLLPTLPVYNVYRIIQLIGIVFRVPDCVEPTWVCSIPVTLIPLLTR